MYPIFSKKLSKILSEFSKIGTLPKYIIKLGSVIFLILFMIGVVLYIINCFLKNFNLYYEFISISIIKTSFVILAEAVIGGLILDYVFKK